MDVPAGVGYASLMHDCHLWLHPSQAAHAQWYRGFRGSRFWGSQGRLLAAREHYLKVYDINDEPLVGAAVYVYACTQTQANDAGTKFFVDRPKFSGNTDADGRYQFTGLAPGETRVVSGEMQANDYWRHEATLSWRVLDEAGAALGGGELAFGTFVWP